MNLFSFFAEQRRRWFERTKEYPKEYVAGGWAALLQAEAVFNRGPLYNAHLEALEAKRELEDTRYKFQQARQKWEAEETQRVSAKQVLKNAHILSQHDRYRAARTRRTLERIAKVTTLEEFEPEVRLRYIQELVRQHLAPEPAADPAEPAE